MVRRRRLKKRGERKEQENGFCASKAKRFIGRRTNTGWMTNRKVLNIIFIQLDISHATELRSCVKVEVDVLGSRP